MQSVFSALEKSAAHTQSKGVEDPELQAHVQRAFEELTDDEKALFEERKINWAEVFAKAFAAGKLVRDALMEVRRLR